MGVAEIRSEHVSGQADIVVRPASSQDLPVVSPVHLLQHSLDISLAREPAPRWRPGVAAMRIGLFVVTPLLFWGAIIRLLAALF